MLKGHKETEMGLQPTTTPPFLWLPGSPFSRTISSALCRLQAIQSHNATFAWLVVKIYISQRATMNNLNPFSEIWKEYHQGSSHKKFWKKNVSEHLKLVPKCSPEIHSKESPKENPPIIRWIGWQTLVTVTNTQEEQQQ